MGLFNLWGCAMNDRFHMAVASLLIIVYLYLILVGKINVSGFEYMVGSIVGGLFGFKIGQNTNNKEGGANA